MGKAYPDWLARNADNGPAKWVTVAPVHADTGIVGHHIIAHTPTRGDIVARLAEDGALIIHTGYPFDGASCAPDLPGIMRAVVVHDLLCQLAPKAQWPIRRRQADDIFLRVALEDGAALARAYHAGIRRFGWLHRAFRPPAARDILYVTTLAPTPVPRRPTKD